MAYKNKTIDDAIDQLIELIDFDTLIIWADALEVSHDELHWLDDMWPDAQAELEREVGEALLKAIEFDARPLYAQLQQRDKEIEQLKKRLHLHEGYEGGISAACGHPIQCQYAAAKVDGGPVGCIMCDALRKIKKRDKEIERLKAGS
jgi:hypothetical protein